MSSGDRSKARKHQGRRKVNMVKMENKTNLQVTFSKRRLGVFKKASELCTLSGAEVAVVVFSPGNKVYSFGHPNVNNITNRFLNSFPSFNVANQSVNIQQSLNSNWQNDLKCLASIESQIEAEKIRAEQINQKINAYEREKQIPSTTSIEKLNYKQLAYLKKVVIDFEQKLKIHVEKVVSPIMAYNGTPSTYSVNGGGLPFFVGSCSKFDAPSYDGTPRTYSVNGGGLPFFVGSCSKFDAPSYASTVPHGAAHNTVIPYDHEATGPGEVDESH